MHRRNGKISSVDSHGFRSVGTVKSHAKEIRSRRLKYKSEVETHRMTTVFLFHTFFAFSYLDATFVHEKLTVLTAVSFLLKGNLSCEESCCVATGVRE